MKELEKYITDEKTGLKYELVGDYYLVAGDDEPKESRPIGIWGKRHIRDYQAVQGGDQMEWVSRMNSIRNRAKEVVLSKIVYH